MLALIEYNLVPLAITMAVGFATGLWMFRGRSQKGPRP